jgi:hypothetical protein
LAQSHLDDQKLLVKTYQRGARARRTTKSKLFAIPLEIHAARRSITFLLTAATDEDEPHQLSAIRLVRISRGRIVGFRAHGQCSLAQSRQKHPAATFFSVTCITLSIGLLLLGLIYYLSYRNQPPAPLVWLGIPPHFLPVAFGLSAPLNSLPSFLHVAAFSLLTCALLRPSVPLALAASTTWAALNVLWELSCANHQAWFRLAYFQAGIATTPLQCTYNKWDIGAALVGAAAAPLVALCFVRLPFLNSSTD